MAADFQKPALPDQYAAVLQEIRDMFAALGIWMDGTLPANVPVDAKRWSSANKRFEQFDGTAWNPLVDQYAIDVLSVGGYQAGHATGQVPVSDGTVNTDLNADLLDGQHGAYYAKQTDMTAVQGVAAGALQKIGGELTGQLEVVVDNQVNYGSAALVSMTASTTVGDAMIALVASGQYAVTIQTNRAVSNSLAFRLNSSGTPYANLEVADGTQPYHAATYGQLTAGLSGKQNSLGYTPVAKTGDTLTGGLTYTSTDPVFGAINEYYAGNSAYGFKVFGYVNTGVDYEFHIADEQGNDILVIPRTNAPRFRGRPLFAGHIPWDDANLPDPAHADDGFSWTQVYSGSAQSINVNSNWGVGWYKANVGGVIAYVLSGGDGGTVASVASLSINAGDTIGAYGSSVTAIWKLTKT